MSEFVRFLAFLEMFSYTGSTAGGLPIKIENIVNLPSF